MKLGSLSLFLRYEQLKLKYKASFAGLSRCQGNLPRHDNDLVLFGNNRCFLFLYLIFTNNKFTIVAWTLPVFYHYSFTVRGF